MAMTACYPNYDMSLSSSQSMSLHHHHSSHASAIQQQSNRAVSLLSQNSPQNQQPPHKDYTIPLHVDCSVEYELPNQAKPPPGARVEPLLMIHPCYFRKMESQRRSPFINNMPNSSSTRSVNSQSSVTATSSAPTTAHMSSSRRPNVLAPTTSSVVAATSSAKNQSGSHLMTNSNVISSHQSHMHQQQQQTQSQQQQQQQSQPPTHMTHRSQNLQHQQAQSSNHQQVMQAQLDDYVHRQMAHISQQTQYQHQQQPNSQYNAMQSQQQLQQMRPSGDWELYMNASNPNMLGKVNIPNQNAYKKSGKRQLAATCANTYSTSHFKEGSLPNGVIRWDEKTASMATIPREYQSGPESITSIHPQQQHHQQTAKTSNNSNASLYRGASSSQQHAVQHMNGKHDRDPMLSGGCIYNNNSNSNLTASNLATSGLWEPIQKSPMAAIPNSKYQAGPESIPNSNHSANTNSSNSKISGMTHRQPTGASVIHHSHYSQQQQQQNAQHQQQHILQNDKIMNTQSSNNNNNISSNLNSNTSSNNNNNVITVKYRQYRNSNRMHPYMMTAPSVNSALTGVSPYFPQLNGSFQQMQQVSCYNV